MPLRTLVIAWMVGCTGAGEALARPEASLDGTWEFRFAADDRGEKQRWFGPDVAFPNTIRVPGSWDVQGFGKPTDKVRHNAVGVGWYRRLISVPPGWQGRRVWLRVGGVHRSAKLWIDGKPIGEHWGYPVAFRIDVTPHVTPGRRHRLVIAVDSRRHKSKDTLTGTFDIIDYMDVDWGGIFDPVTLEATGSVWLEDVFVMPDPAGGKATAKAELGRAAGTDLTALELAYDVTQWRPGKAPRRVFDQGERPVGGTTDATWALKLREAPLWSPDAPNLLLLKVQLRRGDDVLDDRSIRFGQRRLEIRGNDFYLNGERFFFSGYGDDFNHPIHLCPPPDVAFWRAYLKRRRAFGLNGVRHHSMMPPEAYLAAADEVGMLVQPELPIAYQQFFKPAGPEAKQLYRDVWEGYIRQMRNHPSVFGWCMGNELWHGFELGPGLYKTAKELDPTRPVIDSDGLFKVVDRPTLDYLTVMFRVHEIPWGPGRFDKFVLKDPPPKPVISHETSNISVLPDPTDIPKYTGIIRPFWIERMAEQVRRRGLSPHLDAMLTTSRKLQARLIKLNIETARLGAEIDGHHQWLFRDYWTQSTGLVNQFDEVRGMTPEMGRRIFGPAVLLWETQRVNYRPGERLSLRIWLSDFRPRSVGPALDRVRARLDARDVALKPPAGVGGRGLIGPWTGKVVMPAVDAPKQLGLEVRSGPIANAWSLWVFPSPKPVAGGDNIMQSQWLTPAHVEHLAAGGAVWIMNETIVFPTLRGRLKPAWWKGSDTNDATYGNRISVHPAMEGFPNDGYGELQVAGLIDDRPVVVTEDMPGKIDPIFWCLDVPWQMRRKAWLFEARVGRGRLLVSTLDLSSARRKGDPAADWLYARLAAYVRTEVFKPAAELPLDWLRKRVEDFGRPDPATWVEGFAKVLERTEEPQPWYSYRQDRVANYAVRQTDGKQQLRWQTKTVPADWPHDHVTFVWAGGIGWRSEPGGGHFSLALAGKKLFDVPFTQKTAVWRTADGEVRLQYVVRRSVGVDSFGRFFLTVPTELVGRGKPAELTITATANKSKRWMSLNPYGDVVARERSGAW